MKAFFVGIIFLSVFQKVGWAQEIIWASSVIEFSSEYNAKESSVKQVLGKPNKYPKTERSTCAWAPQYSEVNQTEFISVGFILPTIAQQIIIVENFNSGHIQKVLVVYNTDQEQEIYTRATLPTANGGRLFTITLKGNTKPVKAVKLILDKQDRNNPYQIDAIGMTSSSSPVAIKLNELDIAFLSESESLGPNVNSAFDEVYPVISPDGSTLYFDRKYHPENNGSAKEDDIWISTQENGQWKKAINPGPPLNNLGPNFICSISPDGNMAVAGGTYSVGEPTTRIFMLNNTELGWGVPKPIKIKNYTNNSFLNEFSLAADGSTLIMSAQTDDGFGLLDLYISFRELDGTFSTPVNLGPGLNTAGQEMTPFLAADGKTLYFSSNGYPGYGFQDIYMSRKIGNSWTEWSEPLNLGNKVNSAEWEAYYTIDAKGDYAYYSTSKTNGSNLDIYRIKLPPEAKPEDVVWLKGVVKDKITGENINALIEYNTLSDSTSKGNSSTNSSSGFAIILPQSDTYRVKITADKYYVNDTVIKISILEGFKEIIQDFELIPKKTGVIIEMKNILFQVNSSVLEDTSYTELDRVVKFLKENPLLEIEIRGHTNSLCDDNYCNLLSGKRAKSVMDYFISHGIQPQRLTYKGYGKTIPIAENSTTIGRQKNQRVEFMITKVE